MDTLYFVSDLNKTIQKIKTLLKPDGKMFIFYSHKGKAEQSELNNIKPRKNELEEALTFSGFEFRSWDFAKNEHMIWKKTIEIANELKDSFKSEGNLQIYKRRITEAQQNLKWQEMGIISRHLYYATLKS